jgi:hypothetical protein
LSAKVPIEKEKRINFEVLSLNSPPHSFLCEGTTWEIASRPFSKFFNQNEGSSPVRDAPAFNAFCASHELFFLEKADGTCVQLWFDERRGEWRASTLSYITPDEWVGQLFWKILPREATKILSPSSTYLFELCCQENRVVTKYETDRIYLIGARNKYLGTHFKLHELDHLAKELGTKRPKVFSFRDLNITSLKAAQQFVDQQANSSEYGQATTTRKKEINFISEGIFFSLFLFLSCFPDSRRLCGFR